MLESLDVRERSCVTVGGVDTIAASQDQVEPCDNGHVLGVVGDVGMSCGLVYFSKCADYKYDGVAVSSIEDVEKCFTGFLSSVPFLAKLKMFSNRVDRGMREMRIQQMISRMSAGKGSKPVEQVCLTSASRNLVVRSMQYATSVALSDKVSKVEHITEGEDVDQKPVMETSPVSGSSSGVVSLSMGKEAVSFGVGQKACSNFGSFIKVEGSANRERVFSTLNFVRESFSLRNKKYRNRMFKFWMKNGRVNSEALYTWEILKSELKLLGLTNDSSLTRVGFASIRVERPGGLEYFCRLCGERSVEYNVALLHEVFDHCVDPFLLRMHAVKEKDTEVEFGFFWEKQLYGMRFFE